MSAGMHGARVVIVDSGGANLASVQYALARLGCDARVTTEALEIAAASHVILPGVGAAVHAMARLQALGLTGAIRDLKAPVLGICLGMQLLFESSAEGDVSCLGLLPGRAERLVAPGLSVPHMGWNTCEMLRPSPLFEGLSARDHFYFVHSFAAPMGDATLASAVHGQVFSAAIQVRNLHGVQFHPERSGEAGARVLANFLSLGPESRS